VDKWPPVFQPPRLPIPEDIQEPIVSKDILDAELLLKDRAKPTPYMDWVLPQALKGDQKRHYHQAETQLSKHLMDQARQAAYLDILTPALSGVKVNRATLMEYQAYKRSQEVSQVQNASSLKTSQTTPESGHQTNQGFHPNSTIG